MLKGATPHSKKTVRIVSCVVIAAVVFALLAISFISRALSGITFEAGSSDLEETYGQVADNYDNVSGSRWKYLTILGDYLKVADLDTAKAEIESLKQQDFSYTDFYLVANNGAYRTLSGETGFIDLGSALDELFEDGQSIAVDSSMPGRDQTIFYAVPVEQNTIDGFTYEAVAFGYNKEDINSLLSIDAYDGQSMAYLIYDNGRVVLTASSESMELNNVYSALGSAIIQDTDLDTIKQHIADEQNGTALVSLSGIDYYFTYVNVGSKGYSLVSFTPVEVVNESIGDAVSTLAVGLGSAAAVVVVAIIAVAVRWARQQLTEKNLLFTIMSQDMDSIYLLLDAQSMAISYATPNIERLLGVREDEIYQSSKELSRCNTSPSNSKEQRDLIRDLEPGATVYDECVLRNVKTGKESPYMVKYYRPEGGSMVVCALTDGTEEARVRSAIEDSLAAAKSANESKSNFLSNMSHDIRTPMNAILGFASLIDHDADDPEAVRGYTKKIASSGQHLLGLINDVLDISKIEAGKTTLALEQVNVAQLIDELADLVRPQALAKKQELQVAVEGLANETVMADKVRLSQILLNILSNAVKYTPDGGCIRFSCSGFLRPDGRFAGYRFTVADNGIGMSEDYLKELFSPFTREETKTVHSIQGTGLGMAITKNLVDLMGGTIDVHSKPGVGSTFEVFLEFAVAEQGSALAQQDEAEECSLEGLNILAAEDNELNAEILCELLDLEGAQCTVASDGREVLERFEASESGEFDLIFMDIQMPEMNGYEAARAIRNSSHPSAKSIPILAMTANAFSEDVSAALAAGMNAHLSKPIDMTAVKRTVGQFLGGGRLVDARASQYSSNGHVAQQGKVD